MGPVHNDAVGAEERHQFRFAQELTHNHNVA
jgi:hypothetical protein